MARRMPLPRLVVVVRNTRTGETGGGQPVYTDAEVGTIRARIEPLGVGRGAPTQEVTGPDLEPVIADFHALAELELQPATPGGPRTPANLTERDYLTDATGIYDVLTVAIADGRSEPHHYELKLRKITP